MTPSPTITDQINQARQLGYGDEEILGYLSQRQDLAPKISQAQNAGYQNNEILEYLGKSNQPPAEKKTEPPAYQSPFRDVPVIGKPLGWYDENYINPGLDQAAAGLDRFVQGVPKGSGRDMVGGATDVVQGLALGAGTPFLVESGMAAPVRTALGLGTGAAAGWGAKTAAEALHVPHEYAEGLGTAAGFGAGFAANPFADYISRIDPAKYLARIFKPGEHEVHFPDTTPGALADIKTYGNPKAGTVKDTFEAAQPTIGRLQTAMNAWVDYGMQHNAQLDGDILVNAAQQAIPDLIWQRDPATANAIVSEAQSAFGGKRFPVDRVRDWLRTGNSSKFYSQAGYKQNAAAQAGTAPAIEAAQTKAMRNALYPLLDAANDGAGPREVQSRTSAVIDARNNASRRMPQVAGEGGASKLEGAANVLTAGARVIGAPFQNQDIASSFRQLMNPMEGKTNGMLRALYGQLPEAAPIPMPPEIAPGGPTTPIVPGYNPRQLPKGTAPFTQGTSAPDLAGQMQRGYGQTINQPPGLPPGTAPFTQGTSVPDIPGQVKAGAYEMYRRPRLPEGPTTRGLPSPETQSSSPSGDVLDLVAVKDPSTGETHYYQRPKPLTPPEQGAPPPAAPAAGKPTPPTDWLKLSTDKKAYLEHMRNAGAYDKVVEVKDPLTGETHYYPYGKPPGQAKGGRAKSDAHLRSIERRAYGREAALRNLRG